MKVSVRKIGENSLANSNSLVMKGNNLISERFEKMRLDGIAISESRLTSCVFADVHARSVSLGGGKAQSLYVNCIFEGCDLTFSAIGNARFENCHFTECQLSNLFGVNLEALECSFPRTTITKGVFHGESSQVVPGYPERKKNAFYGNDFSSTKLIDVDFRGGIDLKDQKIPDGNGYVLVKDTCHAAGVLKEMALRSVDASEQKLLQSVGSMLRFDCSTGQTSQLLCVADWGASSELIKRAVSG